MAKESINLVFLWILLCASIVVGLVATSDILISTIRVVSGSYQQFNYVDNTYVPVDNERSCLEAPAYPYSETETQNVDKTALDQYKKDYQAYRDLRVNACKEDLARQAEARKAIFMGGIIESVWITFVCIIIGLVSIILIRKIKRETPTV